MKTTPSLPHTHTPYVKAEELQCLRCSHDKRLERMKWLKTNYNLAVEQIKTYETKRQVLYIHVHRDNDIIFFNVKFYVL